MTVSVVGRGRMGSAITKLALAQGIEIQAALGKEDIKDLPLIPTPDVLLDFSAPGAMPYIHSYVKNTGVPLVSGTSGFGHREMRLLEELSQTGPVIRGWNFSAGAAVLMKLAVIAVDILNDFDINLIELHRKDKLDLPSGTACALGHALGTKNISSIRGGEECGTHTVMLLGCGESLEITHRSTDSNIYAAGALYCARLITDLPNGFYPAEELMIGGIK